MRLPVPREFRGLDRRIWILAAARCINTAGFSVVMPYLALYLNQSLGAKMAEVGAIYAAASVAGAAANLVGGELSDRLGRRRVMTTALVLRSLVFVSMGLVVTGGGGVLAIAPLVVVNAVLRSIFDPAAQAQVSVLADSAPTGERVIQQRTAAFGLQRIGINLGWALGPAIGGFLASRSYGTLFFAAAPTTLLAAAFAFPAMDPRGSAPVESSRLRPADLWAVPRPRLWLGFLAVVLLMSLQTTQLYSTMSVYAMAQLHVPRRDFGLLYTINGLMVVALQGLAVRAIHRLGLGRALVVGPLVYALGYALVGFARGFPSLGLAVAVVTLGELLTEPSETASAAALGDPRRPGRAMGIFGLVNSLGNSLGPFVGGNVYDRTLGHPLRLWLSIASLGVLGSLGYARVDQVERASPIAQEKQEA